MASEEHFLASWRGKEGCLTCCFEVVGSRSIERSSGWIRFESKARGFFVSCAELLGAEAKGNEKAKLWRIVRKKRGRVWRAKVHHFSELRFRKEEDVRDAVLAIRKVAEGNVGKPKRALVVVNPRAGRGHGRKIWYRKVMPLFLRAGLDYELVETMAQGHARDLAAKLDVETTSMVVILGGDGTVFEILQGLCGRKDWTESVKIPLCPVPAGSGNALSASAGLFDATTAAIAACKGQVRPLDICSVIQPPKRHFSFLSTTFGFIANLDVGTDHLRWMGDGRFTVGAIREILGNRTYTGRAWLLPMDAAKDRGVTRYDPSFLQQGPPCPLYCNAMETSKQEVQGKGPAGKGWKVIEDDFSLFIACNIPYISMDVKMAPDTDMSNSCFHVVHCGNISKLEKLHILNKSGNHSSEHMSLPYMKNEIACAMYLDPTLSQYPTWLVVDGEKLPFGPVFVECHPGLARVVVFPATM